MDLRKTTILPTDDPKLAVRLLEQLIHERPLVLLVILGTGPDAETFVQRADGLAGKPEEPRWVAWVRQPGDVQSVLDSLNGTPSLLKAIPSCRGFALSLTDEVRDVIRVSEPVPDLVRVFQAFARAEKKP